MSKNIDKNITKEILNLRKQQNEINDKLAELLLQRLALSRKILELKEKNGIPVRDFEREKEIIGRVTGRVTRCSGKENETEYLSKIFENIFQQTVSQRTVFQQTKEKGS